MNAIKIILALASIAAMGLIIFRSLKFEKNNYGNLVFKGVNIAGVLGGIALFIVIQISLNGFGEVAAGDRGVVTRFGAVTGRVIEPGPYFINPLTESVQIMDVQIHAYKATATAASRDMQNVATEITLNFQLDPARAAQMYNEMRRDYGERVLVPSVQEAVKAVTAQFEAEKLITQRASVRDGIEEVLKVRLARHGILMDQMSITNFSFSAEFANAIEAKQVATQNALRAENEVREAKFRADAAIATARGTAETIRIQAEAIRAQGGAEYVQLKAIEKWNGSVPQWVTNNSAVPFVNRTLEKH